MMKLHLLLLAPWLAQAANTGKIYTGFNYGAFWGDPSNAKRKADFLDGFNLAKNLSTSIPFDSARLFTCKTQGTIDDPTEAFDAAVETKTNLLLGFWITPGNRNESPDENVKNEMAALEKGFQKHGQALADLVIGLSVGNEDVFRSNTTNAIGLARDVVSQTVSDVKKQIAASSFANYMKDKPIGHVDTAQYAVVDNADFLGMTAYPYWNKEKIADASSSFQGSLENVKQRAGNTPVWIAEMGWPYGGAQQGDAVASPENLQKYWTEVGCLMFGKYTTFWYELLSDATADQPDWGLLDSVTHQPRIKDLSCPGAFPNVPISPPASSQAPPPAPPAASSIEPKPPTANPLPSQSLSPVPPSSFISGVETSAFVPSSDADSTTTMETTVYVNTTVYITVRPTSPPLVLSSTDIEDLTTTLISTGFARPDPVVIIPTAIPSDLPSDLPYEPILPSTSLNNTIATSSSTLSDSSSSINPALPISPPPYTAPLTTQTIISSPLPALANSSDPVQLTRKSYLPRSLPLLH
ncbi:hypothetical protein N0V83_009881 [Neocucurbitaria cava]|uniref:glucan endo-1,3-beta-D-glucosidase n=1 Tax=Neocucurbitaria cava TaxID=798079 RepID=A0A9W9CI96_9PLEO|nr:hypothetical protein N0V83_009881 [Neocucurbitaria cava]